jgi:hypothetical protein
MIDTYGGKVMNILIILRPERKVTCNCVIFVISRTDFSWLPDDSKVAYRSLFDRPLMNIPDWKLDYHKINKKFYDYEAFLYVDIKYWKKLL